MVHVSGDSRYLFYCNGKLVGRGPAKGDIHHHFYDTFDLSTDLSEGENCLAAIVLDMSRVAHRPAFLGAPCSVMTYTGGFLLEGDLEKPGAEPERLDTGLAGWKVRVDTAHRFQNDNTRFEGYHGYFEHRVSRELPQGWNEVGHDDSSWGAAASLYLAERLENRRDPTSPYGLVERMIPGMEESERRGFRLAFTPGTAAAEPAWDALLGSGQKLVVPARTKVSMILDTGRLTTGFPMLGTKGGAGAKVRLTYAEALRLPWKTPGAKLLGRQQSLANLASHFADESSGWTFDPRGSISGWSDVWEPAGNAEGEEFEPLHWRAFRFIGVDIETGDAQLEVHSLCHRFCAYPYHVAGEFHCSDPRIERLWGIAVHTMRLCSHETFVDCPHYEQMQYAGDTMITSKIAMLTTGDYDLSRQALYHFDWSRLPEGLTHSRYPSRLLQVIPSWSLHWITNVRDYAWCTGDLAPVRDLIVGVKAVLDWFRRHGDADGLPQKLPFWNITDWCPWWPRGVVPGADSGPTCIISAQYIVALREAADLCRLLGDSRTAGEFGAEADRLAVAVHRRFWSPEQGLYLDRPGGPEVSQYGNAWAVICGAADEPTRRRLLERFPNDAALAPGSYFCWHAVFRALEISGAYDRMPEFLGPWHESADCGLDTFVEENSYWRSLCHAWSAHPAIEFLERVVGVTAAEPGFARVRIHPHRCGLGAARGRVCTPHGPVEVSWQAEGQRVRVEGRLPAGVRATLVLPDGGSRELAGPSFAAEMTYP